MQSKPTISRAELRLRSLLAKVLPGSSPTYNHRPKWLRGCELDVHFQKDKIAFEFDGKQHREYCPKFHHSIAAFESQQERDAFKRAECARRGIVVVTVEFEHLSEDTVRNRLVEALAIRERIQPDPEEEIVYVNQKPKRTKFAPPVAPKKDATREEWLASKAEWINSVRPSVKAFHSRQPGESRGQYRRRLRKASIKAPREGAVAKASQGDKCPIRHTSTRAR